MPQMSDYTRGRFGESLKFLPVVFICGVIVGLWLIYTYFHSMSSIRSNRIEVVAFNVSTFLLVVCYIKCILVHPGAIPEADEDPSWEYLHSPDSGATQTVSFPPTDGVGVVKETKRSGERRCCKWCSKYKPDRCHHCRVCRICILKMDHHCPWIYNCVGFRNHKYFFLWLLYSTIDCHIISWTLKDSLMDTLRDKGSSFLTMFFMLFGETLAVLLAMFVTAFFFFHIWLMLKAMTTIEFCEKQVKRMGYDGSIYDRGTIGNIKSVLGENPILWLLPCSPPAGEGLRFTTEDQPLVTESKMPGYLQDPTRPWPVNQGIHGRHFTKAGEGGSSAGSDDSATWRRISSTERRPAAGTGAAPDPIASCSEEGDEGSSDSNRTPSPERVDRGIHTTPIPAIGAPGMTPLGAPAPRQEPRE